jgi:geranylgeranyl pyrophosphate synthase
MLDFAVSDASFGKPSGGADLRLGLATAPTLYAWEEFEEMGPLIQRRFEGEGDVELVNDSFLYGSIYHADLLSRNCRLVRLLHHRKGLRGPGN